MTAVNQSYVDEHYALQPGDEVALIPPVSGGIDYPSPNPRMLITDDPLDAERVTAMWRTQPTGASSRSRA